MAVGVLLLSLVPLGSHPPQFIYLRRQSIDIFACSCHSCIINFNLNVHHSSIPAVVTTTGQRLYPYFICIKMLPKWFELYYTTRINQALDIILNFSVTEGQIYTFQRFIEEYHSALGAFGDNNYMAADSGYTVDIQYDFMELPYTHLFATGLEGEYLSVLDICPKVGFELDKQSSSSCDSQGSVHDLENGFKDFPIPIGLISFKCPFGRLQRSSALKCCNNGCVCSLLRERFLFPRPRFKNDGELMAVTNSETAEENPESEILIASLSTWRSDDWN